MADRTPIVEPKQGNPDVRASALVLLVVESDDVCAAHTNTLRRRGYTVLRAARAAEAVHVLAGEPHAALVIAVLPLATSVRTLIEEVRKVDSGVPIVVAGKDEIVQTSGDAIDLGATDYVADPLSDPAALLSTVGVLAGTRQGDLQLRYLRTKDAPRGGGWTSIVGESEGLQRIVGILRQVCSRTTAGAAPTIFLGGETGTGKGFLAKCMHYSGPRRNRPFVDVNCAALPASLMEAELFGHERGSFTDAKTARAGLFETADGGTLFLDEISAVPLDLQAKLLTAIDEKRVRRIGARQSVPIDVQIVSATHEDLRKKVKAGTFREDLYHRLNVVNVRVPPLRERGRDVVLLATRFVGEFCAEYGMPERTIEAAAERWMLAYAWPGNVRELRNQIERLILLETGPVQADHFQQLSGEMDVAPSSVNIVRSGDELRVRLPAEGVAFDALEREILRQALVMSAGNVSGAARFLSMTRQTLIYRMKKHGLSEH